MTCGCRLLCCTKMLTPRSKFDIATLHRRHSEVGRAACWTALLLFIALDSQAQSSPARASAFAPSSHRLNNHILHASAPSSDSNEQTPTIISGNFWGSTILKVSDSSDRMNDGLVLPRISIDQQKSRKTTRINPLPCVPTLDSEGPLPPNAYFQTTPESKDTCRVQVAWDVRDLHSLDAEITPQDVMEMVEMMQRAVDSGLTTFQLIGPRNWVETNVYGSLIRETPSTVLQHLHLTVPINLQDVLEPSTSGSAISAKSVSSAAMASLSRLGSDCLDDLQIQFTDVVLSNDPAVDRAMKMNDHDSYYLDLLDALQELQRDGLVRTVSAANAPERFLRKAEQAGLDHMMSTNQVDANLLDPTAILITQFPHPPLSTSRADHADHAPLTVVANPLAGGWLTDRFLHVDPKQPKSEHWLEQLSTREQVRWRDNVAGVWGAKHAPGAGFRSLYEIFYGELLLPLQAIARKHGVSVASVVLRWTLQLEHIASTVVSCRLLPDRHYWDEWNGRGVRCAGKPRAQQLRQIFSFELDEEDMELLWVLSGSSQEIEGLEEGFGEQNWLNRNAHLLL